MNTSEEDSISFNIGSRPYITIEEYITASHDFITLITDAEQIEFFAKGFSQDNSHVTGEEVSQLVSSAYQMAHINNPTICSHTVGTIVHTVMHNKDTIGIKYFTKWCLQNCHRIVYWMHRHISHTLASTSKSKSVESPSPDSCEVAPKSLELVKELSPQNIDEEKKPSDSDSSSHGSNEEMKLPYSLRRASLASFKKINAGLLKKRGSHVEKRSPMCSPHGSPRLESCKSRRRMSLFPFKSASEEHESSSLDSALEPQHEKISKSVNNVLTDTCARIAEQYEKQNSSTDSTVRCVFYLISY